MSDPDGPIFDIVFQKEGEQWCAGCYNDGCSACCCQCICHTGPRCEIGKLRGQA